MELVYHGSQALFDQFDYSKMGLNGALEGVGFYFTTKKHIGQVYGQHGYVYTVEFNGKKSLSSEKKTVTRTKLRDFIARLDAISGYLENYGDTSFEGYDRVLRRAVETEWGGNNNDVDIVSAICNAHGNKQLVLTELYKMYGYDHIKVSADWGIRDGVENGLYIALVLDIIKIVKVEKVD